MKDILTTVSIGALGVVFGAMLVLIIRVVWCICTNKFMYNSNKKE